MAIFTTLITGVKILKKVLDKKFNTIIQFETKKFILYNKNINKFKTKGKKTRERKENKEIFYIQTKKKR